MKLAAYINPRVLPSLQRYGYERVVDGLQKMLAAGTIDATEFAATVADLTTVKVMIEVADTVKGKLS